MLPIKPTKNNVEEASTSLLLNQAAMKVVSELGSILAEAVKAFEPDVIVGAPGVGLTLAGIVAEKLGHSKSIAVHGWLYMLMVHRSLRAPCYSKKIWHSTREYSFWVEFSRVSPAHKHMYLDPDQLELIKDKKVVSLDDYVSSGATLKPCGDFLVRRGANIVGAAVGWFRESSGKICLGVLG
jgi:adenine/guanine phosphoribosyltransferase-like PRPP-binding protein